MMWRRSAKEAAVDFSKANGPCLLKTGTELNGCDRGDQGLQSEERDLLFKSLLRKNGAGSRDQAILTEHSCPDLAFINVEGRSVVSGSRSVWH